MVVGTALVGAVGTTAGGATCVGTAFGLAVCGAASWASRGVEDRAITAAIAVMPGRIKVSLLIIDPTNAAGRHLDAVLRMN
jgi:hypothetical protein